MKKLEVSLNCPICYKYIFQNIPGCVLLPGSGLTLRPPLPSPSGPSRLELLKKIKVEQTLNELFLLFVLLFYSRAVKHRKKETQISCRILLISEKIRNRPKKRTQSAKQRSMRRKSCRKCEYEFWKSFRDGFARNLTENFTHLAKTLFLSENI